MKYFTLALALTYLLNSSAFSQIHPRTFRPGDTLPSFTFISAFGDTLSTPKLKGKKILITFNRYVSCPLCNYRTHELLAHYDSLKKNGLIIISVYESGKENLTQYTTKEEIPFYMIPDPLQQFYRQFNVKRSWWKTFIGLFSHYHRKHAPGKKFFKSQYERDGHLNQIGADFLIDTQGVIRVAYYGKFVGDHLAVDEIVKWVLSQPRNSQQN